MGFVPDHGRLQVKGNRIIDQHGQKILLRGMSLFWSQWSEPFYNHEIVDYLVSDWSVRIIRAAIGADEQHNYRNNPIQEYRKLEKVVQAAIDNKIYIIIDWHAHYLHPEEAKNFFRQAAIDWGNNDHVIFETWNEPKGYDWSKEIKPYHNYVIQAIRETSKNLIIVGTPNWSQDVDVAAQDKIDDTNVAYSLHFYAETHDVDLMKKAEVALNLDTPLFVTEWGVCESSGNGKFTPKKCIAWLDFLELHEISYLNWAVFDQDETSSAFAPHVSRKFSPGNIVPILNNNITQGGNFVKNWIAGKGGITCIP